MGTHIQAVETFEGTYKWSQAAPGNTKEQAQGARQSKPPSEKSLLFIIMFL
jgi:hypothetical protein